MCGQTNQQIEIKIEHGKFFTDIIYCTMVNTQIVVGH